MAPVHPGPCLGLPGGVRASVMLRPDVVQRHWQAAGALSTPQGRTPSRVCRPCAPGTDATAWGVLAAPGARRGDILAPQGRLMPWSASCPWAEPRGGEHTHQPQGAHRGVCEERNTR
jgi:hypothetical protein